MTIIFDGTQGITTPAETANNSVTTPVVKSSANLVFQSNGTTEAMRIDTSQRVGIGTSSPAQRFHVVGGQSYVTASASAGAYSRWYNNAQTTDDFQVGQGFASGTDNVAVLLNNANAAMILGTNGTERMRIDSTGRVTKPYQPAFYAYSSGSSMTSGNTVAFNNAPLNVGSSFNTSTYTFTAPIAGNYLFASIVRYDQNGALYGQTALIVNGLNTYQGHYNNVTNANSTYNSVPAVALLGLAAGDTVRVTAIISGGGTLSFSGTESLFYGYLLG